MDKGNISPDDVRRAQLAAMSAQAASLPKKQLIVPAGITRPKGTVVNRGKRPGRNAPCPCGSGKKFKNCHGRAKSRPHSKRPRQKPEPEISGAHVSEVAQRTEAPAPKQETALAMLNSNIDRRIIWAYLETGIFITEQNRAFQPEGKLKTWDEAVRAYDNATPEERRILWCDQGITDEQFWET